MKTKLFIVISILFILSSCRYSKPIFSLRGYKETEQDTLTGKYIKKKGYMFLTVRENKICRAGFSKKKEYDKNGIILTKTLGKSSPAKMFDGYVRTKTKTIFYNSKEKKQKIEYKIWQHKGLGGYYIINKVIEFDKK